MADSMAGAGNIQEPGTSYSTKKKRLKKKKMGHINETQHRSQPQGPPNGQSWVTLSKKINSKAPKYKINIHKICKV